MPELPEVQTIVNDLNKKIAGHRITGVWFDVPKIIKIPKPKELNNRIKNARIEQVKRRGKNILFYLDKNRLLLVHQKLTGHLLIGKWKAAREKGKVMMKSLIKGPLREKVNDYIHLILYLDDGRMIGLSDLRKFAKVLFGAREEIEGMPDLTNLGPEPLDKSFKFIKFVKLIKNEKRKIKQVLMDQEVIAGIGNIYSDEILWEARIHPFRRADSLTSSELKHLWVSMRKVLQKALKLRGTSTSDYRDTSGERGYYTEARKVYQRENEPCKRCKATIKRIKIAGRSGHYCPKCQLLTD